VLEQEVPINRLDSGTKAAIKRLHSLNYSAHEGMQEGEEDAVSRHSACSTVITALQEYYARDLDRSIKFLWIGWLGICRKPFVEALRRDEPITLLILMHWAILLERPNADVWWADKAGVALITELSSALKETPQASMPTWLESIAWAREKVGLSADF